MELYDILPSLKRSTYPVHYIPKIPVLPTPSRYSNTGLAWLDLTVLDMVQKTPNSQTS